MSVSNKTEGQNPDTTQPEDNGAAGKTFTQEEVNRIVSDRLARERAKQEPQIDPEELAQREKDLAARENRQTCAEYIKDKELDAGLLEILDTSEPEEFKKKVDALMKLYPSISHSHAAKPVPYFTGPCNGQIKGDSAIAEAFRRK